MDSVRCDTWPRNLGIRSHVRWCIMVISKITARWYKQKVLHFSLCKCFLFISSILKVAVQLKKNFLQNVGSTLAVGAMDKFCKYFPKTPWSWRILVLRRAPENDVLVCFMYWWNVSVKSEYLLLTLNIWVFHVRSIWRISVRLSDTSKVTQHKINFVKNCPQWGLNSQPLDHQSHALLNCS